MSLQDFVSLQAKALEYPKSDSSIEDPKERYRDYQRRVYRYDRLTKPNACRRKDYLKKLNAGKIDKFKNSTIKKYDIKFDEDTKKWF